MTSFYGSTALTYRDYKGYTARVRVTLTSDTAANLLTQAATLNADITAISNAFLARQTGLNESIEEALTYGVAAQYADIDMKLQITGLGADGRLHRLSIPAPKATCFLTDQQTMNTADANTATLITFLNAHWVSADGDETAITVLSGVFVDRRRKKKLGKWTRTAIGGAAPN